jgi:iron uptake system component EfeO
MRPIRPFPSLLAGSLVALAVAACSSNTGASATPAGSVPAAPAPIAVAASEYRFDPATLTAPAGEVTFRVTNTGTVEHEFEIFEGDQVVDEVEGLVPGLTRDLKVTLEPGAYTYVCKLAGHEEQGMKGTLTVTAP